MSIAKLGDDLMKVPKLDVASTNWVIYKDRFLWSIDARGLLEHVDGSGVEPKSPAVRKMVTQKKGGGVGDPAVDEMETVEAPLSKGDEKKEEEWLKELKVWKQGEAVVKQQIAATIPDSLFMKIRGKSSALEIWESLADAFQARSRMVSVDLRYRLQQQCCAKKSDVHTHFATLRTMRKDLAAMGHAPSKDDFYAIILGSLPKSFESFISALNATASILGSTITCDNLMKAVTDDYDRQNLGKGAKKEENTAFYSNEGRASGSGHGKKTGRGPECFNCHKTWPQEVGLLGKGWRKGRSMAEGERIRERFGQGQGQGDSGKCEGKRGRGGLNGHVCVCGL